MREEHFVHWGHGESGARVPPSPGGALHHCATVASGAAKNELRNYFFGMESIFGNCENTEKNNFFPGAQLSVVMRGQDETNSESNL